MPGRFSVRALDVLYPHNRAKLERYMTVWNMKAGTQEIVSLSSGPGLSCFYFGIMVSSLDIRFTGNNFNGHRNGLNHS